MCTLGYNFFYTYKSVRAYKLDATWTNLIVHIYLRKKTIINVGKNY